MDERSLARGVRQRTSEAHELDVDERIRHDAAEHPERSYREHVAAERIAAESYREEVRRMMRSSDMGTRDHNDTDDEFALEGV